MMSLATEILNRCLDGDDRSRLSRPRVGAVFRTSTVVQLLIGVAARSAFWKPTVALGKCRVGINFYGRSG
jgi:hypothetical protein